MNSTKPPTLGKTLLTDVASHQRKTWDSVENFLCDHLGLVTVKPIGIDNKFYAILEVQGLSAVRMRKPHNTMHGAEIYGDKFLGHLKSTTHNPSTQPLHPADAEMLAGLLTTLSLHHNNLCNSYETYLRDRKKDLSYTLESFEGKQRAKLTLNGEPVIILRTTFPTEDDAKKNAEQYIERIVNGQM